MWLRWLSIRFSIAIRLDELDAYLCLESTAASSISPPPENIKVDTDNYVVIIGETPFPMIGGPTTRERLAEFILSVVEADGRPVSATDYKLKTRDIEMQHQKVRALISADDTKTGSGYCLRRLR